MDVLQHRIGCAFRLRFDPLVENERAFDIPCDAAGQVDLDTLDEADRNAYFYARVVRRLRFAARVVPIDRT